MLGTNPDRRTARVRLVRCVAVVAVLVGVVLLPCADGMVMTGDQPVDGPISALVSDPGMTLAAGDATVPGSGHLGGGLLAACMVLFAAVVAAVVGLRPRAWLLVSCVLARAGVPVGRAVAQLVPSLAKLCLLRT